MAFARDVYTATSSQTDFTITFPYLTEVDVLVTVDGALKTQGSSADYIFANATTIRFNSGQTENVTVVLTRSTSRSSRLVDYTAGALTEANLDNDSLQAFYMAQEAIDSASIRLGLDTSEEWDAETKPINNVVDPTADQDASTKKYVDDTVTTALIGTLPTPISIANGGTASATASAARTALGLAIGSNVQAFNALLGDIAGLTVVEGDILYVDSSGDIVKLAVGTNGQHLITQGASNPPAWATASTGPAQAVQSAIEAETNQDTYVPPDLLNFNPGVAKVWVDFQVDGTVDAMRNVTSVTDTGTGDWTVVIATDMSGTAYAAVAGANPQSASARNNSFGVISKLGASFRIVGEHGAGSPTDPASGNINAVAFGDQA